jgi:hypothetical protein
MATRKAKVVPPSEPVERCETCRCFKIDKESEYCRRYPPLPTVDLSEGEIVSIFPSTAKDNWCAEWKAKLNS